MIFADLIFPVFTLPYFLEIWAPWIVVVALFAEIMVVWLCRSQLGASTVIAGTLGSNALSWFVGILIFVRLPIPNVGVSVTKDDRVHYAAGYVVLAFLIAFVLSTLLEYLVWWPIGRQRKVPGMFKITLLANIASYFVLIVIGFCLNHFSFSF